MPEKEVIKDSIIECPGCGKEWDLAQYSSCYCGAKIFDQDQPTEVRLTFETRD